MRTNIHERRLAGDPGPLIDSLASPEDRLWPRDRWPPMRFDRHLGPGARGGHDAIRYRVESYEPGRRVVFRFTPDFPVDGTHGFEVVDGRVLRHVAEGRTRGWMILGWPLAIRWLHDALLEDALDQAEADLAGRPLVRRPLGLWVRLLRAALARRAKRPAGRAPGGSARARLR
jgi:hypothetical protein